MRKKSHAAAIKSQDTEIIESNDRRGLESGANNGFVVDLHGSGVLCSFVLNLIFAFEFISRKPSSCAEPQPTCS